MKRSAEQTTSNWQINKFLVFKNEINLINVYQRYVDMHTFAATTADAIADDASSRKKKFFFHKHPYLHTHKMLLLALSYATIMRINAFSYKQQTRAFHEI